MSGAKKMSKKGLGRGLSALISQPVALDEAAEETPRSSKIANFPGTELATEERPEPAASKTDGVQFLPIEELSNDPAQPRQTFRQEEIDSLSASIKELGVLQPILVRERPAGSFPSYEIVAGERRWRAAKAAKLTRVPVIVRSLSDQEALEIAIVENVQRSNLSPLEEANAYKRLAEEFGLTQKEIAQRTSKERASVGNALRLLNLPPEVKDLLEAGDISVGHAKAILTVKEPAAQIGLAKKVIAEGLSVRKLEEIVSRVVVLEPERKKRKAKKKNAKSLFPELEDRLQRHVGSKARIHSDKEGKGKIEIEFYSEDELDRILEQVGAL